MKSIPEGYHSNVAYTQFEDTNPLHGGGALPDNDLGRSGSNSASVGRSGAGSSSGKEITLMELESEDDLEYDLPDMWSLPNIGLYCQYAAVGLLFGSSGTVLPFCAYVKKGSDDVCSNSGSVVLLAWSFKIVIAVITDLYRPFGYRRKSWMLIGWCLVLITRLLLAVIPTDSLSVSAWLILLMLSQFFLMFSDVPADGYSVQLGQMEPRKSRGTILATGQLVRFSLTTFARLLQTFLLNGKSTSPEGSSYWSFGLSMNEYYTLIFVLTLILVFPIIFFVELEAKDFRRKTGDKDFSEPGQRFSMMVQEEGGAAEVAATKETQRLSISLASAQRISLSGAGAQAPARPADHSVSSHGHENPTFKFFLHEVWEILQNQSTMYLLIYVIGYTLAGIGSQANVYIQYYVLQLTQFQSGIDGFTTSLALVFAVWLFKKYLITKNWRYTQWMSASVSIAFGLLWIPVYYDSAGLMNAWYTIFIDLDQSFVSGFAQVLFSLTVIELSKPGLEATTYELIITVANACGMVNGIIGTQLLIPVNAIGCQNDDFVHCPEDSVDISSKEGFFATNGPQRYTRYALWIFLISVVNATIWVFFLPRDVAQCHEWKEAGIKKGNSKWIGVFSAFLCLSTVLYGMVVAFLLLDPLTSCMLIVGGTGCS